MGEFDFDELDAAVNNLMTDPQRQTGSHEGNDSVSTSNGNQSTGAAQIAHHDAPTLAVRRRGQFMDVIRPSSRMVSSMPRSVSRQGTMIQQPDRSSSLTAHDDAPSDAQIPNRATQQSVDDVPTPSFDISANMPDEIAAIPQEDNAMTSDLTSDDIPSVSDATPINDDVKPGDAEVVPLISPFLPDPKVEKRPLGEMSDSTSASTANTTSPHVDQLAADDTSIVGNDDNESVTPTVSDQLPEELQADVIAVESASLSTTSTNEVSMVPENDTVLPAAGVSSAPISSPTDFATSSTSTGDVPAGGSIARQYAETPSTGDQTSGPIYDTNEYHTPLESDNPAKHTKPLTWIVWILVLLVVGAGAGIAYFYMTR